MIYVIIYDILVVLALIVFFVVWATGPNYRWEAGLAANSPNTDLFWNIVRRSTLSAFYGFCTLHSPFIFVGFFVPCVVAASVGAIGGFVQGVLTAWLTIPKNRKIWFQNSLPLYIAVIFIGTAIYACGGFAMAKRLYSDPEMGGLWAGICGICGVIASSRLSHWISRQETANIFK